jgi:hypothetical protein
MNFSNFAGNLGNPFLVEAKAALAGQRLSRELEDDPFIHAVSSIAY